MEIFDLLTQPKALIGCLLGFASGIFAFLVPEERFNFSSGINRRHRNFGWHAHRILFSQENTE